MTAAERLQMALKGNTVDRIPVSLYEIDGFGSLYAPDHASYDPVNKAAREKLDNMVMCSPQIPAPLGFLYSGGGDDIVESQTRHENGTDIETIVIHAPKGILRTETKRNPETYTTWTTEYLLKSETDVDRLLSLPYQNTPADMSGFLEMSRKVGNSGIMSVDLCDPMGMVIYMMEFEQYMYLLTLNRNKFRRLLDFFAECIHNFLDSVLEQGGGPLFRIIGPEACTPPYMPPDMFREFVVQYDHSLIRKIQKAGRYARIHCHGKIALIADMILSMQPDALDPVEEAPGGDIRLDDAMRILGQDMCLMGNVQESLFELGTPEDVRREVLRVLEITKGNGRFVLMPTATPISVPLPKRVEENLFAFIETGLAYG